MTDSPEASTGIFYVYEHWRPDKNVCFYVGKGKETRAYVDKRNRYYNNVVKKLERLGISVEVRIVVNQLTESKAFSLEKLRIAFWKFQGIKLTNQTTGGDGGTPLPSVIRRIKKTWSDPELLARHSASQSEIAKIVQAKPEVRARNSAGVKAARARPDVKDKYAVTHASLEYHELVSANSKRTNADPKVKAKLSAASKRANADPKVKAKILAGLAAANSRPDVKAKRENGVKAAYKRPGMLARRRAAIKAAHARPETKAKVLAANREISKRPGVQEKRVASLRKTLAEHPEIAKQRAVKGWETRRAAKEKVKKDGA